MEKRNKRQGDSPRRQRTKQPDDVVYTQPKPFLRRRFILHMATVLTVVVALILGISLFFKVDTITVAGMDKYTAWDISEASGIANGDSLIGISKAKIGDSILKNLPYVHTVRVGIKLPGTVHIEVTEYPVTYAIEDTDGNWWLIGCDGRVADTTTAAEAMDRTRILGIKIVSAQLGMKAVAEEPTPTEDEEGNVIPVTVYGRERLALALEIIGHLEANGILGKMASIDVTDLSALTMWYGSQYKVLLGDRSRLGYKVEQMQGAIVGQFSSYDSGTMDVRFTVSADSVILSPFKGE